jgi:hypothetical protein
MTWRGMLRTGAEVLGDAGLLLMLVWLFSLATLLIGAPLALLLRGLLEAFVTR